MGDKEPACAFHAEPGASGATSQHCVEDRCKWFAQCHGHHMPLCPHPAACDDEDRCIHPVIGFGEFEAKDYPENRAMYGFEDRSGGVWMALAILYLLP